MTADELKHTAHSLVEAFNDHVGRLGRMERDYKLLNDHLGDIRRHCLATMGEIVGTVNTR